MVMQKSDLKNGMIVEISNGDRFIVIDNFILGNTWNNLNSYNEDLTEKCIDKCDIVKVYKVTCGRTLDKILKPNESFGVELIWERNETDWSKVPFGTRVRVWDEETYGEKFEGKFLEYAPEHDEYPFRVYTKEDKDIGLWGNCELIEEPISYEEIVFEYNKHCSSKESVCEGCNYIYDKDCTVSYMVDNYNITRK